MRGEHWWGEAVRRALVARKGRHRIKTHHNKCNSVSQKTWRRKKISSCTHWWGVYTQQPPCIKLLFSINTDKIDLPKTLNMPILKTHSGEKQPVYARGLFSAHTSEQQALVRPILSTCSRSPTSLFCTHLRADPFDPADFEDSGYVTN